MLFKNSVHCPLSTVIYCAVWRSLYVCWYCHYSRFCSHLYTCPPHSHPLAWFWWSHLSVIILVKKSLAYFLIVNLTRPPCIKTKSSLLISMSLTDKEYIYIAERQDWDQKWVCLSFMAPGPGSIYGYLIFCLCFVGVTRGGWAGGCPILWSARQVGGSCS